MKPIEINLNLVNEKVKFEAASQSNTERSITFDYVPPLGDGDGFLGLEVLVMSFAGCVSTAIVGLLRRSGMNINSYKMNIEGIRTEQPITLEKINFELIIESNDITGEKILEIIKLAEKISPVWIAIRNNVEVNYQYKIVNN